MVSPGAGEAGRGGSRRWSSEDQLGSGRATLFSTSAGLGSASFAEFLGPSRTSLFPELLKP